MYLHHQKIREKMFFFYRRKKLCDFAKQEQNCLGQEVNFYL